MTKTGTHLRAQSICCRMLIESPAPRMRTQYPPGRGERASVLIRLLIVEDDANTLAGLVELLGQEGYKVEGALNGRDGVDLFREKGADVVLCDYKLPDIDGITVCTQIRQLDADARLLMITAFSTPEVVAQAQTIGILRIVNKPIVIEELLRAIERASAVSVPAAQPTRAAISRA